MTAPLDDAGIFARRTTGRSIPQPGASWLVTFADLAALMLAFFALMFSMGEIDPERWNETGAVTIAPSDTADGAGASRDRVWRNIETIDAENGLDLDYLANVIGKQIDEVPALAGARIAVDSQRLVVSLPQTLLFDSGAAELRSRGAQAVFVLSGALAALSNELEIVGHTDPQPVEDARWPSNWELSLTRAAVVARELRLAGYDKPLRIAGAGSGRFDAVNPRLPLAARYPLARRVDIVVRRNAGAGS